MKIEWVNNGFMRLSGRVCCCDDDWGRLVNSPAFRKQFTKFVLIWSVIEIVLGRWTE